MKSGDFKISLEHLVWGQPRAYADTIRECYLYCEWIPYGKTEFAPVEWMDSVVKNYAKSLVGWDYEKSDKREWHSSYLDKFEKVAAGKWHIKVIEPFTD